jgi:hypothetical protein
MLEMVNTCHKLSPSGDFSEKSGKEKALWWERLKSGYCEVA